MKEKNKSFSEKRNLDKVERQQPMTLLEKYFCIRRIAGSEFEKFRVLQDRTYQSDFDRLVANIEENSKQTK